MTPAPSITTQIQNVLNELLAENVLPFKLTVGKITHDQHNYVIYFYDSRMRFVRVPISNGKILMEAVRASVLARVDKLSGPLRMTKDVKTELALAGHVTVAVAK